MALHSPCYCLALLLQLAIDSRNFGAVALLLQPKKVKIRECALTRSECLRLCRRKLKITRQLNLCLKPVLMKIVVETHTPHIQHHNTSNIEHTAQIKTSRQKSPALNLKKEKERNRREPTREPTTLGKTFCKM